MVLGADAGLKTADSLGFAVYILSATTSDSSNAAAEERFEIRYNEAMLQFLADEPDKQATSE